MEMKTNKYFKCNLNWNFNLFSLKILFEFGLEKQAVISPKKKKKKKTATFLLDKTEKWRK